MENFNVYSDINARTEGEIYIGVVGPVRTGKSTFIKRFMEQMVLPKMEEGPARERARDELPQSAAGNLSLFLKKQWKFRWVTGQRQRYA